MINRIIIFVLAFITVNKLFSQPEPKELNFPGITENWKYLSYDKNFIKSPLDNRATPYSARGPWLLDIDKNNFLIVEFVRGQYPWKGTEGYLFHNISVESGEENWINYTNSYVGFNHREAFQSLLIDESDIYTLVSDKDIDTLDKSKFHIGGFYATPSIKKIDKITGENISIDFSEDTAKLAQNSYGVGNFSHINSNGTLRRIAVSKVDEDSIYKDKIEFCNLNDDFSIKLPCDDSLMLNSGMNAYEPIAFFDTQIRKLDQNTILLIYGTNDPDDLEHSPSNLRFYFVDLSEGIRVTDTVDISGDVFFPQSGVNGPINYIVKDENIIMAQQMDFLSETNSFIWLVWYDRYGNKLAKIDTMIYNNFLYRNFINLGVKDGVLYLAGVHNEGDMEGFDILKIAQGTDIVEKCGELKKPHIDNYEFIITDAKIVPNDKIVIAFWASERVDGVDFNYNYYYNFNLSDLGMITNTNEISKDKDEFSMFPNPASDNVVIKMNKNVEGKIIIYNELGQISLLNTIDNDVEKNINISNLKSGVYFINIVNNKGDIQNRGKFIKQ